MHLPSLEAVRLLLRTPGSSERRVRQAFSALPDAVCEILEDPRSIAAVALICQEQSKVLFEFFSSPVFQPSMLAIQCTFSNRSQRSSTSHYGCARLENADEMLVQTATANLARIHRAAAGAEGGV